MSEPLPLDRAPPPPPPPYACFACPRDRVRRHHSLKSILSERQTPGGGTRTPPGTSSRTPPSGSSPPIPSHLNDLTRHHSLTRLKDLTASFLPARSKEITFTVPPTVSPLSPRRVLGDSLPLSPRRNETISPMSPRRFGSGDTTPVGSLGGGDYGGDSRTTTPSPGPFKGSVNDVSVLQGAYGLGTINPELYKTEDLEGDFDHYPDDHIGRVWFQLEYLTDSEKLQVTLIKVKNLPSRTVGSINSCDPYVR
ncbi:uncharacterized protein LOC143028988 [Oratosquilla oratoria]|uniref:uncharacterized protein LOC143028988 n=1 Tax=Oratosquilla oratoria TaxID=337810 RepID=UPI003F761A82